MDGSVNILHNQAGRGRNIQKIRGFPVDQRFLFCCMVIVTYEYFAKIRINMKALQGRERESGHTGRYEYHRNIALIQGLQKTGGSRLQGNLLTVGAGNHLRNLLPDPRKGAGKMIVLSYIFTAFVKGHGKENLVKRGNRSRSTGIDGWIQKMHIALPDVHPHRHGVEQCPVNVKKHGAGLCCHFSNIHR